MSSSQSGRERILRAALDVLEEEPGSFTMGRVAQRARLSRQAVYLHFAARSELLVAAARYTDEHFGLEEHLAPMAQATTAEDLLSGFARFLAAYNPLIYPVVRAADAARQSDGDIERAWRDRLGNRRRSCLRIVRRIDAWQRLRADWKIRAAAEWLTSQASVKTWEELVVDLGWSARAYAKTLERVLHASLLAP